MNLIPIGYALLGGLLPALVWLYLMLKEDRRCPEPKRLIALAFIAGMCAVPLALPLEQYARAHLSTNFSVLTAWAAIEELLKYAMAAGFVLWRHWVDEAPDYVIYLVTVALGFAAAENALFLLAPISAGHIAGSVFTADLRFLGSSLLHVIASAVIGFSLALSALKHHAYRLTLGLLGVILAIALHAAFNLLIIREGGSSALVAFFLVWTMAIGLFAAFEVLKYFQYRNLANNTCPPPLS